MEISGGDVSKTNKQTIAKCQDELASLVVRTWSCLFPVYRNFLNLAVKLPFKQM